MVVICQTSISIVGLCFTDILLEPEFSILQQEMKIIILLTCFISFTTAANILAIMPMASPSHHIWNTPLLTNLAKRGHNLTVVSPIGLKAPIANFTDLVIEGLLEETREDLDYEEMSEIPPIFMIQIFFDFLTGACIKVQKSNAWTQLMNYPRETKFDLVIIESIGTECLLGVLPRFGNPPIVSLIAFATPPWMFESTGTPQAISHSPNFMFSASDHMTFTQRLTNTFYHLYMYYVYHYSYVPSMDKVAKEYYGPDVPSFNEIRERVGVEMASFHPALDYPYPTAPNLISVAGIQIKDPKPLPQDLQNFLDDAKEGAILFSLGSNVRSQNLKPEKRNAIMEAFAELPQKILWKFEDETLPGRPANVKIGKWLPQSDILAHPNVKVFITHSGLLSTHEAIYRGVPIIGIPFFGDQPINIDKMVDKRAGIRLDYKDLTKESLLKALQAVLYDSSYRENMKNLSARFQDNPQTPLERAIFWTEYILRHNGAPHLRSAAKDLNFIQYFLLDVLALLFAVPLLVLFVIYYTCCKRKLKKGGKQKQN